MKISYFYYRLRPKIQRMGISHFLFGGCETAMARMPPDVALVEREKIWAVCRGSVCLVHFLGTGFKFAELAAH